jgi:tRNA(Ile)-lysidine synthase
MSESMDGIDRSLDVQRRVAVVAREFAPPLASRQLLLAASGGADSTAMVSLLCEAGIATPAAASVAWFDHALRGQAASEADRCAVQALADRYGLTLDAGAWADPQPTEAAARAARWRFLTGTAAAVSASTVVTGHTSDDQVETVVMRMLRGAGLHGLAGMAKESAAPITGASVRVARPLLCVSREETRAYCTTMRLSFIDDASNDDARYLRNRVRSIVLPALDRVEPGGRAALLALAQESSAAAASVDASIAHLVPAAAQVDGARCVLLDKASLRAIDPTLLPYVLRRACVELIGFPRDLARAHYGLLARALEARTGALFQLPGGIALTVDADVLVLSAAPLKSTPVPGPHELPYAGVVGDWRVRVLPAGQASFADEGVDVRAPRGAVLRGRLPGDRVAVRVGSRKLQDWYIDRKIPRRHRDAAPVLAYGNQVLWTPWGALGELPHGVAWRIRCEPASLGGACA